MFENRKPLIGRVKPVSRIVGDFFERDLYRQYRLDFPDSRRESTLLWLKYNR